MLLFLLSNLYAQEPSAEETDQPSSSEEETTPAGDGDSADAPNKEEAPSKSEEVENVDSSESASAEQVETAKFGSPAVPLLEKTYCVGGVDSSNPHDESSHACNKPKIRLQHSTWHFHSFVQDPDGNCYACWDEADAICSTVFLMENPSWAESCSYNGSSLTNPDTSEKELSNKTEESAVEDSSKSTEESPNIDEQEVPKEQPVRKNGVVTLKNGDMVRGSILDGEDGVRIDVGGDKDVHVPESSILTLSYPKGKFMLEDMGYTRYFYAPTAMPMKPKTGYISQKELLFSAVAYSPTQDVSFLVGTSVPFTLLGLVYGEPESLTGVAGFRYGTKVSDDFYVGGGVEAFFIGSTSLSLPFINATYGDSEQHVTIGGGLGLFDFDLDRAEFAPIFLSVYKRIKPSIALISENWVLTTPTSRYYDIPLDDCWSEYEEDCYTYETEIDWTQPEIEAMALSFGIRFISKKFTTDVGLINIFGPYGDYVPIPWLDVSWYFGQDTQ